MKALLPVYCRPLGYFVIALALFLPFLMLLVIDVKPSQKKK